MIMQRAMRQLGTQLGCSDVSMSTTTTTINNNDDDDDNMVQQQQELRIRPSSSQDEAGDPHCLSTSARSFTDHLRSQCHNNVRGFEVQDRFEVYVFLRRNILTVIYIMMSMIITWESSVEALRTRVHLTIAFPLYLPNAVSLALTAVWGIAIAPGNFLGLYFARLYIIWRGPLQFSTLNTMVMLLVAVLETLQSHTGAFFLRKFLTNGGVKKIPTIDMVTEAVLYVLIVSGNSFVYCVATTVLITITPLVDWHGYWRFWSTWWLGILSAMITVSPLVVHLMAWKCQASLRRPGKVLECIVVSAITLGFMVPIFIFNINSFRPLPYLCFCVVTYTAFRFNRVGWCFSVTAIAYFCSFWSIRERGSVYVFSGSPAPAAFNLIIQVELFIIVTGVIGIALSAAVKEKENLTRKLHLMNVELENQVEARTLELREANDELRISQKNAEQASSAKSEFLANMSHEIRTPIHGIMGLTALVLESELTDDQRESLVSVKECADLLLHIINSVLDLAKIEAGRLELETVPFNIRKMVSSTFRMLQARAQEQGLQLWWEVDKSVPTSFVGDVGKLQQCLLNLVGNALKFTHTGSVSVHVTMTTDQQSSSSAREYQSHSINNGDSKKVAGSVAKRLVGESIVQPQLLENIRIQFEIRDTGIGISQEKLQDMFKPFTQADASTSRLYGGTGLGLCIVQRFVELLGGKIWAQSELGKGSTFCFWLPLSLSSAKGSFGVSSSNIVSGKVKSQPWSLMGGLIFNSSGSESNSWPQQPEPLNRTSNRSSRSRVPSSSDLTGMWEGPESTVVVIDDFAATHPEREGSISPPAREDELASGNLLDGCKRSSTLTQSSNQNLDLKTIVPPSAHHGSGSNLEPSKEPEYGIYVVTSDSTIASQSLFKHSDKKLSNGNGSDNGGGFLSTKGTGQSALDSSITPSTTTNYTRAGSLAILPELLNFNRNLHSEQATGNGLVPETDAMTSEELLTSPMELSRGSSVEIEKLLADKVKLRILLAEDNAINQKVASRLLQKHGHGVTIVCDGKQALDTVCLRHDDFDLVLMDVQMPVMDGLQATELIRKAEREHGWIELPILGLTAHAIQGYQDTCLNHGMDGYLGKPFDIQQLLKTIGRILPTNKLA